jgi:hypothetical protein
VEGTEVVAEEGDLVNGFFSMVLVGIGCFCGCLLMILRKREEIRI